MTKLYVNDEITLFDGICLPYRFEDPDPHGSVLFLKVYPDQDPHYSENLGPEPHLSQNEKVLKAQNRAADAYNGGLEAELGALEGLYTSDRRFLSLGAGFRSAFK